MKYNLHSSVHGAGKPGAPGGPGGPGGPTGPDWEYTDTIMVNRVSAISWFIFWNWY